MFVHKIKEAFTVQRSEFPSQAHQHIKDAGVVVQRVIIIAGLAVASILVVSWIGTSAAGKAIDTSGCIAVGTEQAPDYYNESGSKQSLTKCEAMAASKVKAGKMYDAQEVYNPDNMAEVKANSSRDLVVRFEDPDVKANYVKLVNSNGLTTKKFDMNSSNQELADAYTDTIWSKKFNASKEYDKRFAGAK